MIDKRDPLRSGPPDDLHRLQRPARVSFQHLGRRPTARSAPARSTQLLSACSQNTPPVVAATAGNAPACRTHQLGARRVRRPCSWSRMVVDLARRASRPRRPHPGPGSPEGEPTRLPTDRPRPDAASMEWSTVPTTSCSASRRSGVWPFAIAFHLGFVYPRSPHQSGNLSNRTQWVCRSHKRVAHAF